MSPNWFIIVINSCLDMFLLDVNKEKVLQILITFLTFMLLIIFSFAIGQQEQTLNIPAELFQVCSASWEWKLLKCCAVYQCVCMSEYEGADNNLVLSHECAAITFDYGWSVVKPCVLCCFLMSTEPYTSSCSNQQSSSIQPHLSGVAAGA